MRLSRRLKEKLTHSIMKGRRETVYKMIAKKNDGEVLCYVCGKHVKERHATLEHKIPQSKGGTDDFENLAISHHQCNVWRGNREITVPTPPVRNKLISTTT